MPPAIVILRKVKRMDSVWELCDAYLNKQPSNEVRGHPKCLNFKPLEKVGRW